MTEPIPPAPGSSALEPISELLDLGQRLRRAREGRGIGVAELADRLHLAPDQLTALENGDRSHLHEPVFVIAQAKRVAQALGVDVSQQVEHLRHSRLMQPPSVAESLSTGLGQAGGAPSGREAVATPFRWSFALAITALALLLGVVGFQSLRLWGPRRPALLPRTAAPAGDQGPGVGVLVLRSDEPSWVEVRDRAGLVLFSGQLEKEARFRLGHGLRVLAGRPDLVTATVGREAPRRLGAIHEVDWQEFATPGLVSPPPLPPLPSAAEPAPAP